jgi:hypothetical protein
MTDTILGFDVASRWDYENGFYLTCDASRISKVLVHYELYKSIVGLPGEVVECGVFKGASFLRFASFRESLESQAFRKLIGFDAFGTFPPSGDSEDRAFAAKHDAAAGRGISVDELNLALQNKAISNTDLVQGDILKTLPAYLERNPALRVALLHIDVDIYEPTKVILDCLYERVVPGGVIVLDDYPIIDGETRAVDEFIEGKGLLIEKLPLGRNPAFIRKPRA